MDGFYETEATSSLSLSLQYLLLNKDLNITLRGNDIFKSAIARTTTNVNGIFKKARNYYDTRSFLISVSYKFGTKNIKASKNQTGNEEEKNRINNYRDIPFPDNKTNNYSLQNSSVTPEKILSYIKVS